MIQKGSFSFTLFTVNKMENISLNRMLAEPFERIPIPFKRLLKVYEQLFISKRHTIGIVFAWEVIYYFILWLLFFMWWVLNGLLKISFSLTVRSACANPGNIVHGRATFNSTYNNPRIQPIWTTVTYSCDSGYQRIGDKTRQCLPNGHWSGKSNTTTCKSKNVV